MRLLLAALLYIAPAVSPAGATAVYVIYPSTSFAQGARYVVTSHGLEWQWPDKIFASGF